MSTRDRFFICFSLLLLLAAPRGTLAADSGLVAWWNFDEGSGTVAGDSSGNGNTGTIVGAGWMAEGWNQKGHCLEFLYAGGEDDLVDLGTMDVQGEGMTITAWIHPYSFSRHDARVISKSSTGATGDGHWWMLGTNNGINVRFRLKTNESNTTLTLIDTAGILVTAEWQFITARWDGTTASTHVNTVETGSAAKGGTALATDASVPVAIGNQPATAADGPRGWDGLLDDIRVYNRALTMVELDEVMMGAGPGSSKELASAPIPGDKQTDVPYDVVLNWTSGAFADTHDVYLGTSEEEVRAASRTDPRGVLLSQGQDTHTFETEGLAFGTTYFWRVDEVNAPPDSTLYQGHVWAFETEPVAYAIENITATGSSVHDPAMGPENTVNGSGLTSLDEHSMDLTDMWLNATSEPEGAWIRYDLGRAYKLHRVHIWNHNSQTEQILGYGIRKALIELSLDGASWTELKEAEIPQASGMHTYAGTDLALEGAMARFVRITALSNHSILGLKQYGLSEVRFYYIPVLAREPNPAHASTSNGVDVTLQWRAGRETLQHEVVFSDDESSVVDGSAVIGTVGDPSFDLGTLVLGTPYFWKINSMGDTTYDGDLWTFLTPDHRMVDDFEMYQAKEGLRIWEYWMDGFDDPDNNGAVVGDGDMAETSVVYEGNQSMPFSFNNTTASQSEVTRFFDTPVDLTRGSPESLKLQVRGAAPGFVENTDGTMTIGAAGADIWGTADDFRFVYKRLSGDGSITARVNSAIDVHEWVKAGVMIRANLDAEATNAYSFCTPRGRVGTQWRTDDFGTTVSTRSESNGTITLPLWVRLTRTGNRFKGEQSADGVTWRPMIRETNPDDPTERDILMIADVYIGMAVTSHVMGTATIAVLSDVVTTGNVTGPWISRAIGDDTHPDNHAAPIYVRLADTTGQEKTFDHPNPEATVLTAWDEWMIPMSELSPLNPAKLDSITIGVNKSGVAGKVFIDAIRTYRPYPDTVE